MKRSPYQRVFHKYLLFTMLFFCVGLVIGYFTNPYVNEHLSSLFVSEQQEFTFQSKRAPYSFKFPKNFKMAVLPDWAVYQFEPRIDAVNLGTFDAAPNAGGSATGYIIVEKTSVGSLTLEEKLTKEFKVQSESIATDRKQRGGTLQDVPLPVMTKVQIGNAEGIKVSKTDPTVSNFAPVNEKYYVERRGLRYIIGITSSDPQERKKIEAILQTFNFQY